MIERTRNRTIISFPLWIVVVIIALIVSVFFLVFKVQKNKKVESTIQNLEKNIIKIDSDSNIIGIEEEIKINIESDNQEYKLVSSNPEVINVEEDSIIGISEGEATIYAVSGDSESNRLQIKCIIRTKRIRFTEKEAEMKVGEEKELQIKITPKNATNKEFVWSSSDDEIAIVDNGKVTALAEGEVIIKAINVEEQKEAKCTITITGDGSNQTAELSEEKKYYIDNVPFLNQMTMGYPTGCEAFSAVMAAQFAGYNIEVETIIENTPTDTLGKRQETISRNIEKEKVNERTGAIEKYTEIVEEEAWVGEDPFKYFIGYPTETQAQGAYGCFAVPIVTALRNSGISCKNISGCTVDDLYENIRKGKPVIVWCTYNAQEIKNGVTWYFPDGSGSFSELVGEHCSVLIGYDENNVYLNDPIAGQGVSQPKDKFESNWHILFDQAIIIN